MRPRWTTALRLTAVVVILFGPIATAAWDLRRADRAGGALAPEEQARYLSRRNPVIDQLLPGGAGGTRVVEHLDGNAGMAFTGIATIALAVSVADEPWPGQVELHERAHLVDAFLPDVVARLMARMPAPDANEYAAKDRGEHFAEMAATAWTLAVPPDGMCVDGTPREALLAAEARVPGTAGFVVWYLQHPTLTDTELATALRPIADELSRPYRDEWAALWTALDSRRRADETFTPWRVTSVRAYITAQRASARASGGWIDRVAAQVMTPSLWVLSAMGH